MGLAGCQTTKTYGNYQISSPLPFRGYGNHQMRTLTDKDLCLRAFDSQTGRWEMDGYYGSATIEAKHRGLSISDCRNLVGGSSPPPGVAEQKPYPRPARGYGNHQNNRSSSLSYKCSQAMKILNIHRRRIQLVKNSVNSYNNPFSAFAGAHSLRGAAINAQRLKRQRHLAEERLLQMQQELVQGELLVSRHCN
jgi:hypothetical protein